MMQLLNAIARPLIRKFEPEVSIVIEPTVVDVLSYEEIKSMEILGSLTRRLARKVDIENEKIQEIMSLVYYVTSHHEELDLQQLEIVHSILGEKDENVLHSVQDFIG